MTVNPRTLHQEKKMMSLVPAINYRLKSDSIHYASLSAISNSLHSITNQKTVQKAPLQSKEPL